ncbi:hypothetical protein [Comamonas aquatica]|uniref:hypothetical protein n=1 Tax=Comamonas aquatica TaxID=225991 RepID=UPI0012E09842|nr:hypothetical protein [Comamonas aquatica]
MSKLSAWACAKWTTTPSKPCPPPDQELLRRAVEEAQSRDEVLDLLQELAARHGKEKEALNQQVEESELEHAAVAKRLEVVIFMLSYPSARALPRTAV